MRRPFARPCPDEFKAQVEAAQKAGETITTRDAAALTAYFEVLTCGPLTTSYEVPWD